MVEEKNQIYAFDNFRLDVRNRELLCDGKQVTLPAKAFDMLVVLIENHGRLIEKDELFSRVWPDQIVEESNLTVQVSAIRKALGERKENTRYISTVTGRGYRFAANLKSLILEEEVLIERHSTSRLIIETDSESITAETPIKSIAVLPFKPLVAANRDESLELGIADTLITRLGCLPKLVVRPISAVRGYTALDQNPVVAGQEQKVDAVLDGSIQKSEDRIRVTSRLVNVSDGQLLWSGKFDDVFKHIFEIQDSISRQVAEAIVNLTGGDRQLLDKPYTENFEAYQLYLKGRFFWNKVTEESLNKSIECFRKAIDKDPEYALAYAGLADSYILASFVSMTSPEESYGRAKTAAIQALQIDNKLAEAHAALALILTWHERNWLAGEAEFKRALDLNPNYSMARQGYGRALMVAGKIDESLAQLKRAQELDPLSLIIREEIAGAFLFGRRYDEAISQTRDILEMDSRCVFAYIDFSVALERSGRFEEALAELNKALSLENENVFVLSLIGFVNARMGEKHRGIEILERLDKLSSRKYVSPFHVARVHLGLGNTDEAFQALERGCDGRDYNMLYLLVDPTFESLHLDKRFSAMVSRIGLPCSGPNASRNIS